MEWHGQLFGSLCYQVFLEYRRLSQAYERAEVRHASLLAWSSRNLLELSVWCQYFAKSGENARQLYEDAGRDAHDILQAFEKWGCEADFPADWREPITAGRDDLIRRAANEGSETLGEPYTRVAVAAEQCGIRRQFALHYKLLSKFSHPTALKILGGADDKAHAHQRECFFALGFLFFTLAVEALEDTPA